MSPRPFAPVALALIVAACAGAPSAAPSLAPSQAPTVAPVASPLATNPATPAPTASPKPVGAPFAVLPAGPPAGYQPGVTCDGEIGANDPVAVVDLAGTSEGERNRAVVQNFVGGGEGETVCELTTDYVAQLIDAQHLVINANGEDAARNTFAIVDLPEGTYHWFQLPHVAEGELEVYEHFVTVAPGLDAIVWLRWVSGTEEVHVTTATGDRVIETYDLPTYGRCSGPDDSREGAFTATGSLGYVLRQPDPSLVSLLVFDGTENVLSVSPPDGGWADGKQPMFAVWSPTSDTLYYRQAGSIWRWEPGATPVKFLAGVRWSYPTISSDGRTLVYTTDRGDGTHDLHVVDLASGGDPRRIATQLGQPAFLGPNDVWAIDESIGGDCGPRRGLEKVIDATTGAKRDTSIVDVRAIWPATSSNR